MRKLLRSLLVVLIVVVVIGLAGSIYAIAAVRRAWPQVDGRVQVDGLQAGATIVRDAWGVPHLYAANPHDLFFAQGYAHAQDRFWQLEFSRRAGSGRLSEVLGESALPSDRFIRTVGWHRTAALELEQLDGETLAALEAYAEGVNAYLASHRGCLGLEFTVLGLTGVECDPEPWTPFNTLTWAKVMAWDLGGNMHSELLRAQVAARLGSDAVSVLMPPYWVDHPVIVPHPLAEASLSAVPAAAFDLPGPGFDGAVGSNNWAIAGSRTETGTPILANDTHLGIQMPSIWYEVGLHCEPVGADCPYDVTGFSFPGAPGVIIGHNARIAWGVTNLGPDVQDLFVERVNPADPNQVEYRGEWVDVEIVREEIAVAGWDEPVVVNARVTRHGPIINDVLGGTGDEWSYGWQPLALSWTALQPGTLMRSVLLLDRAANWPEFRQALSYWDVPGQNFVYADVEGNVGYQATGRIPVRASGDGSMPAPGWSGEYEWVSTIPFDDLPYTLNPVEGYVVTANNAVVGPDYAYFLSMDWDTGYRARRIVELVEADPALSLADVQAMQGDGVSLYARDVLPFLLALDTDAHREALDLLRGWDGDLSRDSGAAALFEAFRLRAVELTFADEAGEQLFRQVRGWAAAALPDLLDEPASPWFDDVTTPLVETRDDVLLRALDEAVAELTVRLGDDVARWRWGDLHTATFENGSLGQCGIAPVEALFNRGPVEVDGSGNAVNSTGFSSGNPYDVSGVPSQRQVVDVGDWTRSLSMHTTGQSGHPYHPHYDDMIDPWRNVTYHSMLWERSDVEADAEGVLVLEP